jgi:hypothetical protein
LLFVIHKTNVDVLLGDFTLAVFYSSIILAAPFVFRMTFGLLPFEALGALAQGRLTWQDRDVRIREHAYQLWANEVVRRPILGDVVDPDALVFSTRNDPRELLFRFALASRQLAERVYTRAGVYLIVGVFIAKGGLGFFYIRTIHLPQYTNLSDHVLSLLPGFGVLFFIEFVALFFLRQHRAAMDDFRYYDAVRRHREENLVILTMFKENTDIVPTADVIKAMNIYSGTQKLMEGETTEILETRRLQRDDIVIFEKLIEAFSAAKNAATESEQKSRSGSRKA